MSPSLRPARPADFPGVTALLRAAGLPLDGLDPALPHFVVAEDRGRVVAAAGLEPWGDAALLRSVVVDPERRGTGLGRLLVERALGLARASGMTEVFLLTTTAADWFPRFGFRPAARESVPEGMRQSAEFRGACPASAALMRLALDQPTGAPGITSR